MDCRTFRRKLEDYLEDGLDFPGRFGMERHAEQCFACGKVVEEAQQLGRKARDLKRVSAPVDFEAALLRRIQEEGLARPAWNLWRWPGFFKEFLSWRPVTVGAAAIAVLGFGVFMVTRWVGAEHPGLPPVTAGSPLMIPAQVPDAPSAAGGSHVDSAELPASSGISRPAKTPARSRRAGYSTDEPRPPLFLESADSEYVEYLVPGPGDRQLVMRLPKTIRMRYGQPSEDYFIRNVSH
jgi:hypothetical protein